MKKMKRILAALLAIAMMGALLAGCGSNDSSSTGGSSAAAGGSSAVSTGSDEPLEFYFVALMTGGAAWSRAEKGFNDACAELGINGHYVAPVERNNQVEMAELLDKAVVAGADAVIGCWLSTDMFGPGLEKARAQGAVTASVQTTLDEEYIDFQIGTDQANIGVEMANALVELAGDREINVIFMAGSASEITNLTFEKFEQTLVGHDNITSLGIRFDEGSAATANQILADESRTGNGLNAVVCLDSSAATIGAASYVQEQGLEEDWITIGIDASADILNYVKAGALDATMNQDFYAMGYESAKMAYEKIVNGVEPEFLNDTGCYLILPEDVDSYAEENGIDLG